MEFQTVVSELNVHDLKNILILAESLGIDSVHFQELQYYDGLERPWKLNRQKETVPYVEHITNKKNIVISGLASIRFYISNKLLPSIFHPGQCEHTIQDLRVQEDGKILSCCFPGCKVMGDLHENTLEEIISTKEFDAHMKSCKCKFSGVKFARPKLFSSKNQ
jgi:MoaA/NifB/PqqE/SkfB family radical SAM enzyme